jgi:hypothetical protein
MVIAQCPGKADVRGPVEIQQLPKAQLTTSWRLQLLLAGTLAIDWMCRGHWAPFVDVVIKRGVNRH